MERSLMESQQFKGKQSITEESFVEVEQVRASKNIGRPPTGRMIKQSTRPNLRSRSVDLLEEERCSTSCESSKSEPFTRCRTVVFENSEEFVRAGGDLMIEQLASCSSYDSLNSRVSFQIPAQESKPKRNEFLQLKKQRRGDKLSSTSSEIELFGNYNNTEYWQDYVLPRGSLTTISHNMTMGPVGQIQTALFRNKYRVALKSEKMSSKDLQKELILLKYLGNYPTILSCYGYVVNGPSLQIVYELSPYGSLDKVLRENKVQSFPLALMVAWMSDLADAMQFLHSKGIIHGDIKAENILVFERLETKLCNFHTAKSVLSDSVLSETFSALSMDDDAKDHKLISTYSADITNFFNTTHHILDGKVLKVATESTLQKTERDKYLEDSLLNRPFVEFNAASKLYYVLTSFTEFEQSNHQFHRYLSLQSSSNSAPSNKLDTKLPSKKLSEQLFALVEEFCDGDPREPLNENYKKLQRYELLIKSKIDNFVPLPPKSRLRQKLFGSSTLRRYYDIQASLSKTLPAEQRLSTSPTSITSLPATLLQHQAVYQQQQKQHQQQQQQQLPPASSLNEGFATQKVIDPRTTLTEWLIMDYQCSFAEAEEFSAYFLRNGIDSKEGVIHMLEITPNFLHKYGSNYELAGRIKEQLLNPTLQ